MIELRVAAILLVIHLVQVCKAAPKFDSDFQAKDGVALRDINLGAVDFQCPGGVGIYWHPECDKYYTCYAGQPTYLWQCRDNLLFDLTYNGCNYPELVDCGDRIRPGTQTTTPRPPFVCTADDGFFPVPGVSGCVSDFYSCVGGVSYPQQCPGGNVFDPVTNKCVSPGTGNCGPTTTTTTTTKPFVCPADDGFFPDPDATECVAEFYSCVGGVAYPQQCPGVTVFDPITNRCVTPGTGNCATGISTTTSTTTAPTTTTTSTTTPTTTTPTTTTLSTTTRTPTTSGPFVCPGTGQFPYPGDCTLYYVCAGGIFFVASCPPGQVFNPEINFCQNPELVPGCNSFKRDIHLGVNHFHCLSAGAYPHPMVCNQYFTCNPNEPSSLWQCKDKLLFDERFNSCNLPEYTDCRSRMMIL